MSVAAPSVLYGYYWYIGRADDVFKSSGYRISPFELESALIEHAAVAEAAVVPSPDQVRLNIPKAYISLKPGFQPTGESALSNFRSSRERLAPFKRLRRLEFGELPKTISGKIRRMQLRRIEEEHQKTHTRPVRILGRGFPRTLVSTQTCCHCERILRSNLHWLTREVRLLPRRLRYPETPASFRSHFAK